MKIHIGKKAMILSQKFHFKIKQFNFYYSDISRGTEFLTLYWESVQGYEYNLYPVNINTVVANVALIIDIKF